MKTIRELLIENAAIIAASRAEADRVRVAFGLTTTEPK